MLVEHGMVDLEALTVYLGLELGIPIATGAMLERAKRAAVRLLQPSQAFKHKCVPLVVQDRQLIAAIEDPHDFANLEALTAITGYRVLPRVAPEVRIYYYIERYYGVARPARFREVRRLAARRRGHDRRRPARPAAARPAAGARRADRRARPAAAAAQREDRQAVRRVRGARARRRGPDRHARRRRRRARRGRAQRDRRSQPSAPVTAPRPVAAAARPAADRGPTSRSAQLAGATDRNRIVDVLLGYAAATFDAAVVFTVRDQFAFGWKAIGELPGHAHVEHLLIPLGAPSVVQAAVAAETGVFHGPLAPSTVNSYLYKVLHCAEPPIVTAGVIAIGKRVVNVLYGHGAEADAAPARRLPAGLPERRRGVRAADRGVQAAAVSRAPDRQSVIGGAIAPAPVVWQRLQLLAPAPPPPPPTSLVTIGVTVGHAVVLVVAVNEPDSEPAGNAKLPSSSV